MGLDVYLYQFKDVDTDAILKLWKHSGEPWVYDGCGKWKAKPPPERENFPSDRDWAEYREKSRTKAKQMGIQEKAINEGCFGGEKISFPSKQHPEWPVGEWYSFSTVRGIIKHFTGHDIYFIFPEAKDVYGFFRPDWAAARLRLAQVRDELKKVKTLQLESYTPGLRESFDGYLAQLEVIIETLDFVLNSGNPREFLLYWSD